MVVLVEKNFHQLNDIYYSQHYTLLYNLSI